jgi:hypothetical protein
MPLVGLRVKIRIPRGELVGPRVPPLAAFSFSPPLGGYYSAILAMGNLVFGLSHMHQYQITQAFSVVDPVN